MMGDILLHRPNIREHIISNIVGTIDYFVYKNPHYLYGEGSEGECAILITSVLPGIQILNSIETDVKAAIS